MKNKISFSLIIFLSSMCFTSFSEAHLNQHKQIDQGALYSSFIDEQAQAAFGHLLHEVEIDDSLTFQQQQEKVEELKSFADHLSDEVQVRLIALLIEETRCRILDILQEASLENGLLDHYLLDYQKVIDEAEEMNVEFAREMLFFVAELKIHRQYVYDFGVALGCPEKQLLRHDLCKLCFDQFEGYVRYFRGGRLDKDKIGYLASWQRHQLEEHHHESYSQEGFDFDSFSEERLRMNMLESVADLLAATKQRGGSTLIDWLVNVFPKKNPHPRLIPLFRTALIEAQALCDEAEADLASESIFKGLSCWNDDVEQAFNLMKKKE